jgi:hypothetical protein
VQVTSSVTPADLPIREAIAERPGLPIRLRFQPDVLRKRDGATRASYQPWRDVHWVIEAENLDEVRMLRECLAAFFWIAGQGGIGQLHGKLVPSIPVGTPEPLG